LVSRHGLATEGYKAQLARVAGETAPKEELDALRRELERTRGELDTARRALDEERVKAAAETEGLLQKKLQAVAAGNAEETRKLESLLKEREGELERRRQQVTRFEQVTEDYKVRLARLEGESASLRQELEQARRQVAQSQKEIEDKKNVAAESERRVAAIQQEIVRQRAAASPIDPARIKALEAEVEKSRAEFAGQKQEIARLETAVAGYRVKVAELETRPEPPKQVVAMAPPAIQIIDPPIVTTRDSAAVKVRAGVATRPVVGRVIAAAGLLSFTANDLPLNVDADGYFTTSADLGRGRTQVTLVAVDRQGKRTLLEFFMEADAAAAGAVATASPKVTAQQLRLGKYYALVIGNQNYEHLPRLNTPEADAADIAALLKERYGFAVTVLLNATRTQMLKAVNVMREQVTEKDNLLIYYAGHGQIDRVNSLANWLPIDAEPNDNSNWIANSTLTENLNLMSAKHILVVADSCYSGAMTRSSIGQLLPGMSDEQRRDWLRSIADKKSRNVLTSGGVEPVMDGGGGKHSIFAQNLIDILAENQDALPGMKLFEVISARVVSTTKRMQIEQRPEYAPIRFAGGESGDFIFVLP
jgi:hypothetical protein